MSIQSQFNRIAGEYDQNRRKFIPCFDDFYQRSTDFICESITPPRRIMDLGAGTGLLSYYWYQHFKESHFVLVDIAEQMLQIARQRFAGINSISFDIMNYQQRFPQGSFDTVISALSIHHLEHHEKQTLFSRIYSLLPAGGLFVNYDQFCAAEDEIGNWYNRYWINGLYTGSLSTQDLEKWEERRLLDRECSVEQEISWLKKGGFKIAECIYSYQKFSVVVALK